MSVPEELRTLPEDTARSWLAIRDVVPDDAYLGGGTAIALRLHHRVSRDLDFFLRRPVDLAALAAALDRRGALDVDEFDATPGQQTLNVYLDRTKLQFLDASTIAVLEPLQRVAGLQVAGLGDLLAMKLKVIRDRGELRDYYDVMTIERQAHRWVEEGIPLAVRKYRPQGESAFVYSILRGLGYLDDVEDDPLVPESKAEISTYWRRRLPAIESGLSQYS